MSFYLNWMIDRFVMQSRFQIISMLITPKAEPVTYILQTLSRDFYFFVFLYFRVCQIAKPICLLP